MSKLYENLKTDEETTSATIALQWHRRGDNITVWNFSDGGTAFVDINGAKQPKKENENRDHCKRIADDLEDYSNGLVYRCPDCGEIITVTDDWSGEKYKCPGCDTVHDGDDLEQLSMWDYFDDALDIEYRIGSDRQLRSVQIMVTCGGPNIYIDTATKQVELYWWGDRASYPIDYDTCNEIDAIFEELYNC